MKIRYIGELLDHSGYGIAALYNIALLHKMGHELQCIPIGAQKSADPDWKIQLVLDHMDFDKESKPDIVITHIYPPENIEKYKIEGVPTIAYLAWETDMLSSIWAYNLNKLADMVVTTCTEMQKVFVRSGVKVPVKVLGPTIFDEDARDIQTDKPNANIVPKGLVKVIESGKYIFYGVFQWIERKDPKKLVSAFIQEFDSTEGVMLLMKSYRIDYSQEETRAMIGSVNTLNRELNIIYPPEVRIIPNRLSAEEINMLHRMSNCYVTPHRGEGTGLGIIDAILHNNPVICTPYGGPKDFTTPETSRWLEYKMVPIQNPLYCYNYFNAYMNWADASLMDLRKAMRFLFEHHDAAIDTNKAKERLLAEYCLEANSARMNTILLSVSLKET